MNRTTGLLTIILGVVADAGAVYFYLNHHTLRALVLVIGGSALLVVGILFLATAGRKKTSGT
jgi:hypothetical protein